MTYQEPLTVRETEVLALVAQGLTNRQIAAALVISRATVQNHLRSTFDKLGVTSRIQAGLKANLLLYVGHMRPNGDTHIGKRADAPPAHPATDPLRGEQEASHQRSAMGERMFTK